MAGDGYSLVCHSGYLVKLGKTRFGIDPTFLRGFSSEWQQHIAPLLSKMEFGILSHAHVDHMDPLVLRQLANTEIKWIVPNFLSVPDIPEDKLIRIRKDETITWGDVKITAFESRHFRPGTTKGLPEFGYLIEGNGKRLLFPGDVRDYDWSKFPDFKEIDLLFAHLWTGDELAQADGVTPNLLGFAKFVASYSPKRVCITHLFETGRKDESLWSYRSAGMAADEILRRTPDTDITVPEIGFCYSL